MGLHLLRNFAKRTILQSPHRRIAPNSGVWTIQRRFSACNRSPQQLGKTRVLETARAFFSSKSHSSSSSSSSNPQMGFLAWYLGMLESRPILTKCVSACLIYSASDFTSQMISLPSSSSFDFIRIVRMAGYGLIILGPAQHFWFNFLARKLPKRDTFTTLKKLILGQLIFGPIVTSVFFSFNAGLQGEGASEIAARLKRDLLPTLINGVMYWPICDFLTFKAIPVNLQPLVNCSFAYLWTIYLTYMASLTKAMAN